MSDRAGSINPIRRAVAVTKSDDTILEQTRALWVGTQGNLAVRMADGQTVTFPSALGWLPIEVTQVLSTGTAASGIVACY